jgi:hypothetical protein
MHLLAFESITNQAQDQVHEGVVNVRGEVAGLHDRREPVVEFLVGCDLVEKAVVDEPDFAGVALTIVMVLK